MSDLVDFAFLQIPDWRNAIIVARNPGAAKRATSYSDRLRLGLAVIHGEQKDAEQENIDGRHSPPPFVAPKPATAMEVIPCKHIQMFQLVLTVMTLLMVLPSTLSPLTLVTL